MEHQFKKISVVIPVYNVEQYLKECVDSVLKQTYTNYEIILVDDGSTDVSGTLCDWYAKQFPFVKVIHQENGGLSVARNAGLKEATGEYVYFLDSDDYIEEVALEHLIRIAEEESADIVFFDGSIFFTDCEEDSNAWNYQRIHQYPSENGRKALLCLLETNEYRTAVPLMLLRTDYLLKHNLFFKEGILHEDELFTFLVYNADGKVCHCHEELYARRIRPASIMTSSNMIKRYESLYQIYMELSDLYTKGEIKGEAGVQYMIRISKSVLGKYNLLDEEYQKALMETHQRFKRDVIKHKGFGDIKLKIKCSKKIMSYAYRLQNKLGGLS